MIRSQILKSLILKPSIFKFQRYYVVSKEIIEDKIRKSFKDITELDVQDTDSGCGQFFSIKLKTSEFKGKPLIQQHRMVNEILKEELKQVHSIILKTSH